MPEHDRVTERTATPVIVANTNESSVGKHGGGKVRRVEVSEGSPLEKDMRPIIEKVTSDFVDAVRERKTALVEESDTYIVVVSRRDDYGLAVGARVMELVDELVQTHPGIAGTPPDVLAEAIMDVAIDVEADRSELADLLAPFWSAKRTQEALGGLSRSAMLDRRKTGSLLGLKTTDGDIFYPVAQFETHEGRVRVKPGLRSFMMALRERDPWTVAVLLHTPAEELGGYTPLDWVRRGRDPHVLVEYARTLNREFSR